MNLENLDPSLPVGAVDQHLTIEAACSEECRIENLGAVGSRQDDDADARIEPVHFGEELV